MYSHKITYANCTFSWVDFFRMGVTNFQRPLNMNGASTMYALACVSMGWHGSAWVSMEGVPTPCMTCPVKES